VQLLPGHVKKASWLFQPQTRVRQLYCVISSEGNNWVGVFVFLLLKADSKKTKTPTWSDEGAEHRKNSYIQRQRKIKPFTRRITTKF
jgi:hypothetical protein